MLEKKTDKLDIKDLKILVELENNSRQSYGKIAKKVGLSKEVVLYRIKNLEKIGIIRKYITPVDIYKLGYLVYSVLIKFYEIPKEQENIIYEYIKNCESVSWAAVCESGSWDVNLTLRIRSAYELTKFFEDFENKFGNFIAEKELMYTYSVNYFKRNFGIDKQERTIYQMSETKEKISLTKNEEKLLHLIAANARKPITDVAKELSVSLPTAISMLKKLENEKIIQGYRVFTSFAERGYSYYKLWFRLNALSKKDWDIVYSFLSFNEYVLWTSHLIGSYSFSIEIEVPSAEEFRSFINRFKEKFHHLIKKRDSFAVSKEIVLRYF
ncbi:MAG: winged helix-turn-helix transcriptional regulator [Candidatus Micrarchaeota archaeon]